MNLSFLTGKPAQFGMSLLLTGILIFAVFSEVTLDQFFAVISNTSKRCIAGYVTLSLIALVIRARRSQIMVSSLSDGVPKLSIFILITATRNAFVDLVPARIGELSYVYLLTRFGISTITGVSTFLLAIALDITVLSLLLVLGLKAYTVTIAQTQGVSPLFLGALLTLSVLLILLIVGVARNATQIAERVSRLLTRFSSRYGVRRPRLARMFDTLISSIRQSAQHLARAQNKQLLPLLILHTFALRILKYFSLYVLLVGVIQQWEVSTAHIPIAQTTLAFVLAEGVASLPVSGVMGFGAYEGMWSLLFTNVCGTACSHVQIPVLAFAIHLITQLVGYSCGICALIIIALIEYNRGKNAS